MAEVFDLDYLLQRREPAPAAAKVRIAGREYRLRGVEGLEHFLVFVGTVQRLLDAPVELPKEDRSAAALTVVSARYTELVAEVHRMIRALVVGLPEEVLREHFGTLPAARALLMTLVELTQRTASELVKKNAGGGAMQTQSRTRRSRRGRGRRNRNGGASTSG